MTGARERRAGRVLVVDDAGRVLLLRDSDPGRPQAGSWWLTPGGGAEPGESVAAAARRELAEETGLRVGELGPPVARRVARFRYDGVDYVQRETLFAVRVPAFTPDGSGWTEAERRSVVGHRWWSVAELAGTAEEVYPPELAELLARVLATLPAPSPRR